MLTKNMSHNKTKNKTKNKTSAKAVLLFMSALMFFSLTACGNKNANVSSSGNALNLSFNDIEKEGRQGAFVLNKDETFSPIISDVTGYAGTTEASDPSRYVWYTDNNTNVSKLIPVVTQETPLVAIYDSNEDLPSSWYLEKYADKGYTIGAHVYLNDTNQMVIQKKDPLDGTSASKTLSQIEGSDDEYIVDYISGTKDNTLPLENVDNNMQMLLGFDKNKLFTFKFFRGTKTEVVDIYADTRVFQSTKYVALNDPYKKTSQGYFIINMPLNLASGYYYLSDIGLFKYEK